MPTSALICFNSARLMRIAALVVKLPRTDPLVLDVAFDELPAHDSGERPVGAADRPRIFISHRRDDASAQATRLADSLAQHFGADAVRGDYEWMQPGSAFSQQLKADLENFAVVLVLIGPRWLQAEDAEGQRRLDDPQDLVRMVRIEGSCGSRGQNT